METLDESLEKLGVRIYKIEFSEQEKNNIDYWRETIEDRGQELWRIYHWIVNAQDGRTHGVYRLRDWLEHLNIPDHTGGKHWAEYDENGREILYENA